MSTKVHAIEFKVTAIGEGVIQATSNEVKIWHNRAKNTMHTEHGNNNYIIANKDYTQDIDENGKPCINAHLKISSECLRHHIHLTEMPFHSPQMQLNRFARRKFTGSIAALTRGWLHTYTATKHKGIYNITAATESGEACLVLEPHTQTGNKETKESSDDKSGTGFYFRENTGVTKYTFEGSIENTSDAGFISLSDSCDRRMIAEEDISEVIKIIESNFNAGSVSPVGYYLKEADSYSIHEKGFCLNNEQKKIMFIELLKRIATLTIRNSKGGTFKVTNVKIKFFTDTVMDVLTPNDGWLTIRSTDVPGFNFKMFDNVEFSNKYTESDPDAASAFFAEITKTKDEHDKVSKLKKAEKKAKNKPTEILDVVSE